MRFELVPILGMARELYAQPRDMARFRAYLRRMLNERGDDVVYPPMVAMNPMGREHVLALVDALLAMDAEGFVRDALREAERRLPEPDVPFKAGITVIDDVRGGWTHSELSEAELYFPGEPSAKQRTRERWLIIPTWTRRGAPTPQALREESLAAAARAYHAHENGVARTLRDALAQEGAAWRFAGRTPTLDASALARIEATLEPHLDAPVFATLFAGMYGDRAASAAGHAPLGVPERAGFELALARANDDRAIPLRRA